jgi:hypothetical protein
MQAKRILLITIPLITWFAVILQLYLAIQNRVGSISESVIRFFSYFTILSNTLVAICFTCLLLAPNTTMGKFFSKPSTLAAVTAYIFLVGIGYQLLLRHTWHPEGLQKLVDELLHSVIPVLVLIYWFAFAPKDNLKWKHAFIWLIFPAIYLIYMLIRGAMSDFYPYPFVRVNELGYGRVVLNCLLIGIGFLVTFLVMIGFGKLRTTSNQKNFL